MMRSRQLPWGSCLLFLALLAGCNATAGREPRLRLAAERMEPVLRRPELAQLAGGKQPEKVVAALFSEPGLKLWPPLAASQTSYDAPLEPPGCIPPRIVFVRSPDVPWCVVVKAEGPQVTLSGYGQELSAPLFVRRVSL